MCAVRYRLTISLVLSEVVTALAQVPAFIDLARWQTRLWKLRQLSKVNGLQLSDDGG